MDVLTPMVLKEGFLTTPYTECRGCPGIQTFKEGLFWSVHRLSPGTHTFKEGPSRSVHRGYPDTHTFKEGLSRSVRCGCTGTHIFLGKKICSLSFLGTYDSVYA